MISRPRRLGKAGQIKVFWFPMIPVIRATWESPSRSIITVIKRMSGIRLARYARIHAFNNYYDGLNIGVDAVTDFRFFSENEILRYAGGSQPDGEGLAERNFHERRRQRSARMP